MRDIETIRIDLASKRIEVEVLARELHAAYAVEATGHASLYGRLGGNPDPQGCGACGGTGIKPGPWQPS
jgi:hypothetical protein